tara:strand:- start:2340 stop:4790 length:2451 start_codon:yes stop_codon:yes gene_type:complete
MGFQVSPGVEVKEIDLTNVIPAVSTSIGGYSGYFRWGPVNEIGLVSSEKELAGKFGTPDAAHTQSFLTAASFLKYGSALKVVRAGDSTVMKNAVAGTHEVLNGGIEGVTISSTPTQFLNVDGTETLHIVEDGGAGTGATITPLYQVNTASVVGASGYQLTAIDPSNLSDGAYTITVQGESVSFTVASAAVTTDISALGIYVPVDPTGQISVTDTVASPDSVVTNVALTGTAVTITSAASAASSPAGTLVDGDILTVYTTSGDTASQPFTVTVTDNVGTPEYALAAGVADVDTFDTVPSTLTGVKAYTAAGVIIPGLFFTVGYDIEEIASTADGSGYVIANTTVGINLDVAASPAVITSLEAGNFTFDEQETEFSLPAYIANEEAFESVYPPASTSVLPGLLFAKYPGEVGNSLGAYVIDAASWSTTPTGVQNNFDAAPTGTEVHVLVYDATGGISGVEGSELEKWSFLDRTPGARYDNGANSNYQDVVNANSNYIYIARPTAGSATTYEFAGGLDVASAGVANPTDINAGLEVLSDSELVDVNLLFAQVDATGNVIANKVHEIASTRKDCVAFLSPIISASTGNDKQVDVKAWSEGITLRGIEGSYAVIDSTALYVYNKYADNYVYIPASGHMAGLCAKTDDLAEPWFSPAGLNRGGLKSVVKLAFNPKKAERDELYKAGINPIVSFPGEGIVLFGDKTAQSKPSAFDRINVRRLFIVLEKAIATAAKYQLFELNDSFTRAMFRNMTEPFLRDVKGRRGITDFLVVCDETNNTGEVIDTNRFVADIYIKPARSINFITLNFIATRTGVDFSEIVGK